MNRSRISLTVPAALITTLICAGCGLIGHPAPPSRFLSETFEPESTNAPDLSKHFNTFDSSYLQGANSGLPVGVADVLAKSAGGTWVVYAPDALVTVKGLYNNSSSETMNQPGLKTVLQEIESITDAGTPITYDLSHGYVYMVFGTQADLINLRAVPPLSIKGLYLSGADPQTALSALGDVRNEKITVDPRLEQNWVGYVHRSQAIQSAIEDQQGSGDMGEFQALEDVAKGSCRFSFTNVRRCSESELMGAIARSIGGHAVSSANGAWQIEPLSPGTGLNADISQLTSTIDQLAGISTQSDQDSAAGTTYAERHGQISNDQSTDSPIDISDDSSDLTSQIQEQIQEYNLAGEATSKPLNQLGELGDEGVSALAAYLTPTTPPEVICKVLRVLMSEPSTSGMSRTDVYNYVDSLLAGPDQTVDTLQTLAELTYSMSLISAASTVDSSLSSSAHSCLSKIFNAANLPYSVRINARMSLLRFGCVSDPSSGTPVWKPALETNFTLTPPPTSTHLLQPIGSTPPNAIKPLAIAALPTQDAWAVFTSDRLGNIDDIWLAHAVNGIWQEFLFTGQQYADNQGSGSPVSPGGCIITVKGDTVILKPSNPALSQKYTALQAAYQKASVAESTQATQLSNQIENLSQQVSSMLTSAMTFSLTDLRRDSDGDGLTDLEEQRLGTDPHNAETMSNGRTDAADQNPLVHVTPQSADNKDRREILQLLFQDVYSGDTSMSPIVVVLDQPFQQPFYNCSSRILCLTPEKYDQTVNNFSSLRRLLFGGPTSPTSTLLRADGPCLFSSDSNSAEVHFSLLPPGANGQQTPADYVALFQRSGDDWKLRSLDTWHFRSSSSFNTENGFSGFSD